MLQTQLTCTPNAEVEVNMATQPAQVLVCEQSTWWRHGVMEPQLSPWLSDARNSTLLAAGGGNCDGMLARAANAMTKAITANPTLSQLLRFR